MSSFKASGLITITTDFGHKGPFAGIMKGVILSRFPNAKIVDLTNESHVHWPAEAGFWVTNSYDYFPKGTVHLAVVDPGVGTDRSMLVVEGEGHVFVGPDNGLLSEVVEKTHATVRLMSTELVGEYQLSTVSDTFHGRDIFAPVVAALASGEIQPVDCGSVISDFVPSSIEKVSNSNNILSGVVITLDNFGNLITNIDSNSISKYRSPLVKVGGLEIRMARTYGAVRPGEFLALINSFGVLEIACAEQSAAKRIGINRGAPVKVVETVY
jgi:S-adenosyl-L-methionine hydrolase (adenosine-forming)